MESLRWWRNQDEETQQLLCCKYYRERNPNSLTGREIEEIYQEESKVF
jgi:hypothetical protein